MIIEGDEILLQILDKQFDILGMNMSFSDIPEDGIVTFKGKKEKWYNVYKFTEDQEEQWEKWAKEELRKVCADETHLEEVWRSLDMTYGFVRRYKKDGELF